MLKLNKSHNSQQSDIKKILSIVTKLSNDFYEFRDEMKGFKKHQSKFNGYVRKELKYLRDTSNLIIEYFEHEVITVNRTRISKIEDHLGLT